MCYKGMNFRRLKPISGVYLTLKPKLLPDSNIFALPASVKASCHLAALDRPHVSVQSTLRSVDTSSHNLGCSGQGSLGLVHLSAPQGAKRPFL